MKQEQHEHKGVALVMLGIVAVAAIVGLVMMFVQATTTGQVYGGSIKGDAFPMWTNPDTETGFRPGATNWYRQGPCSSPDQDLVCAENRLQEGDTGGCGGGGH